MRGAVVTTTAAHHRIIGSIPAREVNVSSLVASHALLHTTPSSFLARELLVPSPPSVISYTHARSHTHTHTYAHILLNYTLATYRPIHHATSS